MRDTFVSALLNRARNDRRVVLVTGDLGFGVLDQFARELPAQYINAGVAEQNMTGLAAGLAMEGKIVFTYSIANFPTLRCLEQIRNDVLYHDAPVNVVAIGGGFSYGSLGMSHHATEDIAVMRALAGLRVFAPCDESETRAVIDELISRPAPSYLRLDKSKVASGAWFEPFSPGRLRTLREGSDVCIVGYGGILGEALAAADRLADEGISCAVYSAHTLKPIDPAEFVGLARSHRLFVTLEEHNAIGGLSSAVADALVDAGVPTVCPMLRLTLPDRYSSIVGAQEYLRKRHGLDAEAVAASVKTRVHGMVSS